MTSPDAAEAPDSHSLIFVAGLHRSGTTLLTRLLAAHPQVSGFSNTGVKEDEGQHLQKVYPPARSYGGAGRFAFDPRSHLTEQSPLVSRESADRIFKAWSAHWDLTRPYLVEKSPPNLVMTRFLQALYPAARFVIVMRHPVVVSLSTSRWRGPDRTLERLLEHWFMAYGIFRQDAPHVHRCTVVTYERLISDPFDTLAGLAEFLGLTSPIDHVSLDFSRSDAYVERWQHLLRSRRPGVRRLVAAVGERWAQEMESYGYSVDGLLQMGTRG